MIPKIIHQIWLGPDDPPIDWMQTWVDFAFNSGWEYRVWTEKTIPPLENFGAWNYYEERESYHGMSDVARVELLERHGGWYIDADTELIDPLGFGSDPMHEAKFVVSAHPDPRPPNDERYPNGIIGSVPGHPILSRYVNMISQAETLLPVWATIGGGMLYRAMHVGKQPFHVLPAENFLPFHFGQRVTEGEPVYAIHHQYSTRKTPEWQDLKEYRAEDL